MTRDNMTRSGKVQRQDLPHSKGCWRSGHQWRIKLWVTEYAKDYYGN
jgi:hypothetical protein